MSKHNTLNMFFLYLPELWTLQYPEGFGVCVYTFSQLWIRLTAEALGQKPTNWNWPENLKLGGIGLRWGNGKELRQLGIERANVQVSKTGFFLQLSGRKAISLLAGFKRVLQAEVPKIFPSILQVFCFCEMTKNTYFIWRFKKIRDVFLNCIFLQHMDSQNGKWSTLA